MGPPPSGSCTPGDTYIELAPPGAPADYVPPNGEVLTCTSSGTWLDTEVSIQGPAGATGATGQTGATGATGADGTSVVGGVGPPPSGSCTPGDTYIELAPPGAPPR